MSFSTLFEAKSMTQTIPVISRVAPSTIMVDWVRLSKLGQVTLCSNSL